MEIKIHEDDLDKPKEEQRIIRTETVTGDKEEVFTIKVLKDEKARNREQIKSIQERNDWLKGRIEEAINIQ